MSDELLIEQPQSANWLAPGKRLGHLIAFFDVVSKEKKLDNLSGKEKEVASFRYVDLDEECELISGLDNHPGITFKLSVGNPAAVLGRIGEVPSKFANDTIALLEHNENDAARLKAWFADWKAGRTAKPAQRAAAATPAPTAVRTTTPAALAGGIDLASLDAETLALLQKRLAQQNAG